MALITVLVVAACGNKAADTDAKSSSKKETVTIKHNSGTTDVPKNPKKVVVFNFGMLDTLDELGSLFPQAATTRTVINAIINKDSFFNSSHLII